MAVRKIGLLTGGGDSPGLNAVIRAVVKTLAGRFDCQVVGFRDGFEGLFDDRFISLGYDDVAGILTLGGTVLGTSNKGGIGKQSLSSDKVRVPDAQVKKAIRTFKRHKLEGVICIGGDGSLTYADRLNRAGVPCAGVPKTIDNDVMHTDQTFGFDTASTVAAEAIDRLHSTAQSHKRVMLVETMGRDAGWIALQAGLAGGGDVILIPEVPYSFSSICAFLQRRFATGRRSGIIVMAEGAREKGRPLRGKHASVGEILAARTERTTGIECRATVLGYVQRGGIPTPFDRVLATRYGTAAARMAAAGDWGKMVCLRKGDISSVALSEVAGRPKKIPLDAPLLLSARDVGTHFGD